MIVQSHRSRIRQVLEQRWHDGCIRTAVTCDEQQARIERAELLGRHAPRRDQRHRGDAIREGTDQSDRVEWMSRSDVHSL